MGLTLDELLLIQDVLKRKYVGRRSLTSTESVYEQKAIEIIKREIRLKELERTIPKSDVNGNFTTGHGE